MNDAQKFLLEKNINRFDSYISAVNNKSAFLVSFNTFVLGALLIKHDALLSTYYFDYFDEIAIILHIICLVSVSMAVVFSLLATGPFLKSSHSPKQTATLLFFDSVAGMGFGAYSERIKNIAQEDLLHDLTEQTYILSTGLSDKFYKLKIASATTVFGTIGSLLLCAALRFIDLLF